MRITGPFKHINIGKNFFLLMTVGFLLISSAIAVVYSKHKIRMSHIELQKINKQRTSLNTEWSKLLLEKSTWMAGYRAEQIAKTILGMQSPEQVNIIRQ